MYDLRIAMAVRLRRSLLAKLASGLAIGIILPVAALAPAAMQQPKVQIQELHCEGDPETILIKNTGSTSQSLAGWKLQSDPAAESFDLSAIGNLAAGASVLIESGPGATATFIWSKQPIFRDGDQTDYARLVDNNGQTVHQLACGQPRSPTPAPAAATPTPPPAGQIPNGGGPPSVDGFSTPLLLVALGGWLTAGGLLALVLPWLRLAKGRIMTRPYSTAAAAIAAPVSKRAAAQTSPRPRSPGRRRTARSTAPSGAALLVLGLAFVLALLLVANSQRQS